MPYDYSKIKKWTAGAPDELEVGMVLELYESPLLCIIKDITSDEVFCACCANWYPRESVKMDSVRWAWHPDFEPEGK